MNNTSPMSDGISIGVVAGEASGDILGAGLMAALRQHFPNAFFFGVGGPQMLEQGFHSLYPQDRLAVMGLVEPLKRLPELLRIRRSLRQHFIDHPPSVFIGIDSPDFNLSLEGDLRRAGIPTVHYVSPSVWAWRQGRIKTIVRSVDLMLTLLPFEAAFYKEHGVPVEFVGHHLADQLPLTVDTLGARRALNLDPQARIVALLPGSRGGEVKQMGELFLQAAALCLADEPSLQFVIPAATPDRYRQLHHQLSSHQSLPVHLLQGQSRQAVAAADVALVASGTATLETLLLKKPMVVAYKMAFLTYLVLSRLVKSPYISLPNLLAGEALVPELIQQRATPEALAKEVLHFLHNEQAAARVRSAFAQMHVSLRRNASQRAAEAVIGLIAQDRRRVSGSDL